MLRVVTNEGEVVADQAVSVRAPAEDGYIGILRDHAPLVTLIRPGAFTWRRPSGETRALLVGDGLLEVAKNRLTLLTSSASAGSPADARPVLR
jgi:F-type H+-transporting ATPase subunit epsilon